MDINLSYLIQPEVISRHIDDEQILINLESDRIFSLNSTGARFWELLAAGWTVGAARDALLAEYDVTTGLLEEEMDSILNRLIEEGFLVDNPSV